MTEQQEQAYKDYRAGMKYKDIAAKYNVSINTVSSWKKRHKWSKDGAPKNSAPKKNGAPYGNRNAAGHGAPLGNHNAVGNRGGHPAPGNHNAVTHGLYAKYLPAETLEIAKNIADISPIDLLWENICIKYAAIIRAQKIMYVKDQDDLTKVLKKKKNSDGNVISKEREYELQFAWDKQAVFLTAQSRAMGTLNNMIKQYEEMCRTGQADEEQRLRIEKLKVEVNAIKNDTSDNEDVTFAFDRGVK